MSIFSVARNPSTLVRTLAVLYCTRHCIGVRAARESRKAVLNAEFSGHASKRAGDHAQKGAAARCLVTRLAGHQPSTIADMCRNRGGKTKGFLQKPSIARHRVGTFLYAC
jgi:hypothetical protein